MRKARPIVAAITMTLVSLAAVPSGALADDRAGPDSRALVTFEGRRIDSQQAASLSCHDVEVAVVRCFASADVMIADLKRAIGASDRAAAIAASGYVIAYEHTFYGGSARTMSIDYDDLGDIGWNDRISSFKSFGASGGFREHSPPGGFDYTFGASSQVSNVGAAANDKFSALELD